eukprot:1127816-Pleurochrysis_carterae.AAC.3
MYYALAKFIEVAGPSNGKNGTIASYTSKEPSVSVRAPSNANSGGARSCACARAHACGRVSARARACVGFFEGVCACARACVFECVRACARACVRACVRARACLHPACARAAVHACSRSRVRMRVCACAATAATCGSPARRTRAFASFRPRELG